MRSHCLVRGRLNKLGLVAFVWSMLAAWANAAQQPVAPTISVTINKSMVFRLAEKAKRVSVSQPAVADVLVVAPSQLLINGKAIGTTSLIIFDEKGDVTNYDLVVAPDIAALRNQLRTVFPNERVEISTSGPSLVLRPSFGTCGELSPAKTSGSGGPSDESVGHVRGGSTGDDF
jgi:Flp pilus assembly secretin CpaC